MAHFTVSINEARNLRSRPGGQMYCTISSRFGGQAWWNKTSSVSASVSPKWDSFFEAQLSLNPADDDRLLKVVVLEHVPDEEQDIFLGECYITVFQGRENPGVDIEA